MRICKTVMQKLINSDLLLSPKITAVRVNVPSQERGFVYGDRHYRAAVMMREPQRCYGGDRDVVRTHSISVCSVCRFQVIVSVQIDSSLNFVLPSC